MARSYGSYSRERDKDKPYRTAEIALGFLGDLIAQNNQQSLDYQKLALQQEATQATADYRESTQASKTLTLPTGEVMQYNPDTNKYDMQIGGQGAGVQNWGELKAKQLWDTQLDGHVEWEDTDNNGILGSQGDRPWVGKSAQHMRDYKTAKANKEEGFESKHPEVIIEGYKTVDAIANPDRAKEAMAFLEQHRDYQVKLDAYNELRNIPLGTKYQIVEDQYESYQEQFEPKKLTKQDLYGIETQLNRREVLISTLEGRTETTVYGGAATKENIFSDTKDTGELNLSRRTLKGVELTPSLIKKYEAELGRINKFLDSHDIKYSKRAGAKASWVD